MERQKKRGGLNRNGEKYKFRSIDEIKSLHLKKTQKHSIDVLIDKFNFKNYFSTLKSLNIHISNSNDNKYFKFSFFSSRT